MSEKIPDSSAGGRGPGASSPRGTYPLRAVLFDLDGTLVDSVPDIAHSVDETMRALGLPARGEQAVRQWVGNGIEPLLARALVNAVDYPEDLDLAAASAIFEPIYRRNNAVHSRLYANVQACLRGLAQQAVALGCVTNKPRAFTEPLLEALGIASYFDALVCADEAGAKKPDPRPLHLALERLGASCDEAVFVGDSVHDVEAARRAGMAVLAVPYGYNHGQDIASTGPDAVIDDLLVLLDPDRVSDLVRPISGPA